MRFTDLQLLPSIYFLGLPGGWILSHLREKVGHTLDKSSAYHRLNAERQTTLITMLNRYVNHQTSCPSSRVQHIYGF